jgi:hypothetical protein
MQLEQCGQASPLVDFPGDETSLMIARRAICSWGLSKYCASAVQDIAERDNALELDRNLWVEWSASQLLPALPAAN